MNNADFIQKIRNTMVIALIGGALAFSGGAAFAQAPSEVKVLPPKTGVGEAKRFALVIGNGAYREVNPLKNTVNDATAVAAKLQDVGFEVYFARDLDRRAMNDAISQFLARIDAGSEALVYYAGHGVELFGSNFLLPVDVPSLNSQQERLLRSEAINLTDLLGDLEGRSARVSIVILDACRDNPFRAAGGTRSLGATRGLGRVEPPRGSFVIYSAGVGEQALDNVGTEDKDPNGLFTRQFIKLISTEGLELRTMVRQLRSEVRDAALKAGGFSQIPSYYDQLLGDFFFKPKADVKQTPCDALAKADAGREVILSADLAPAFQACERAVAEYPSEPRFVHLLYNVQEQMALQKALKSNLPALSEAYLALFPTGRFVGDVRANLAALNAKADALNAAASKADVARAETVKAQAAQVEAARAELAKAEAAKAEARAEVAKAEAARAAAQAEAARAEAAKAETAKAEAKTQEARAEAAKMEALAATAKTQAAQAVAAAEAARNEAAKAEAARSAANVEATRAAAQVAQPPGQVALASPKGEPPPVPVAPPLAIDPVDIARLLQIHLKRVGCDPGTTDGQWNGGSQKALEAFNSNAGTKLNVKVASLDALDAVRAKASRVCPLVCGSGQRVEGDKCVQIICDQGSVLGANGTCQKRKEPPQRPVAREETRPTPRATAPRAAAPSAGGSKCFTFNGQRFCE
jgi:uncharacterized caspase-like protein